MNDIENNVEINSDNIESIELKGYQKEKLTVNLTWANIFGILMFIPCILIFGLPFHFNWGDGFVSNHIDSNNLLANLLTNFANIFSYISAASAAIDVVLSKYFSDTLINFLGIFVLVLFFVLGIVLHELIHGIFFAKYAKNGFKSVKYGVLWKYLTPYCHCKEPLTVRHFIVAAIMPTIILGVIPAIISILTGNILLLVWGIIFTVSGAGDILIIYSIRKFNETDLVLDHPSEVGVYIFRKII